MVSVICECGRGALLPTGERMREGWTEYRVLRCESCHAMDREPARVLTIAEFREAEGEPR